jgi:hypothetical protein
VTGPDWPFEGAVTPWTMGRDQAFMRKLQACRLDRYDWRAAERLLNSDDQFTTVISRLDIHLIHRKGSSPSAIPLLLMLWRSSD